MQRLNGYEKAEVLKNAERLPIGGYVVKLLNAEEKAYDWGRVLLISFDVDEGDYKGFYETDWKSQPVEDKKWRGTYRLNIPKEDGSEKDNFTMRVFKTVMTQLEEDNNGFHWDWDEKKLKGLKIGALMRNKEWEINGKRGFYTECFKLLPVENVRSGKFKMPEDKLLPDAGTANGFNTAPVDDSDLPF